MTITRWAVCNVTKDEYSRISHCDWTSDIGLATLYESAKGARVAARRQRHIVRLRSSIDVIEVHEIEMTLGRVKTI
jgi:hypothetical protein